jgi:hypothetical protein
MNLKKWSIVILAVGLLLALSTLSAQADPPFDHPYYRHHHGNAYGWDGPGHHRDFYRHRYFRRSWMGPHYPRACVNQVYAGPPPVAYVGPVAPIIGFQPYQQPQPYYSAPGPPGLHGQITF